MFETVLSRQRAFWLREATDRPLFGCHLGPTAADRHPAVVRSLSPGLLRPEDLRIGPFLEDCERLYRFHREFDVDYCFVGSPFPHFPWLEAIVGCPVRFSGTAFFAEPCVEDWQRWRPPEAPLETPWGRKLLELMRAVAEHAGRRYPVGATLMRGPADMLAALSGPSRLPLDLFDCPEAIRRAAEACADVWIQVGQAQLALVPESTEGYMAGAQAYRTWAPEKAIWLQDDATALFSPRLYRDLLLPQIERILGQFPCTGFHLHGKIAWGIDLLLSLPKLDVIEFGPDAGQGMNQLFPESKRIQEHKKLVFLRWYEADLAGWLGRVLTGFPPNGLSIQVQASNAEEGMIVKQLFDKERERCA
jgi:hypothetical protein